MGKFFPAQSRRRALGHSSEDGALEEKIPKHNNGQRHKIKIDLQHSLVHAYFLLQRIALSGSPLPKFIYQI
jgi:hypothetical protein